MLSNSFWNSFWNSNNIEPATVVEDVLIVATLGEAALITAETDWAGGISTLELALELLEYCNCGTDWAGCIPILELELELLEWDTLEAKESVFDDTTAVIDDDPVTRVI